MSGVGPLPGLSPSVAWSPRHLALALVLAVPAGTASASSSQPKHDQGVDRQGGGRRDRAHHGLGPDAVPLHRGHAGNVGVHGRLRQNLAAPPGVEGRPRVGTEGREGPGGHEGGQRPLAGGVPQDPALPLRGGQEEGAGARAERGQGLVRRVEERDPGLERRPAHGRRQPTTPTTAAPARRRRSRRHRRRSRRHRRRRARDRRSRRHRPSRRRRMRRRRLRPRRPPPHRQSHRPPRRRPRLAVREGRASSGVRWLRCRPWAR